MIELTREEAETAMLAIHAIDEVQMDPVMVFELETTFLEDELALRLGDYLAVPEIHYPDGADQSKLKRWRPSHAGDGTWGYR